MSEDDTRDNHVSRQSAYLQERAAERARREREVAQALFDTNM
jgi:hypothetical protein